MPCTAFAYELEHVFFRLDTLVVALYRFKGFEAFQFLDFLQMSAVVLIAFEKGLSVLFQRGVQFLELVQPFFLCLQAVQRLRDVGQLGLVEPYAVLYAFQFVGIEHLFAGLLPFGFSLCDLAERPRHLFGHVCTELSVNHFRAVSSGVRFGVVVDVMSGETVGTGESGCSIFSGADFRKTSYA